MYSEPARAGAAVTPSDSTNLDQVTRALWVGVEGDLAVEMESGDEVTFTNVYVGWHPLRVRKVLEATTAGEIVAVW